MSRQWRCERASYWNWNWPSLKRLDVTYCRDGSLGEPDKEQARGRAREPMSGVLLALPSNASGEIVWHEVGKAVHGEERMVCS